MPTRVNEMSNGHQGGKELAFQRKRHNMRDRDDSAIEESDGEYSESELETFINEENAQSHPYQHHCRLEENSPKRGTGVPKKLKKHRRKKKREAQEEDSEPSRPLAESIHANRRQQRIDQHPMSGKSGSKGSRGSRRSSRKDPVPRDDPEQEPSVAEKENQRLQKRLDQLQVRMKLERKPKAKGSKKSSEMTAMETMVAKKTKQDLWKICKFIKSDQKLYKATKYVMLQMDLQEHEGLSPTEKMEAQETWIASYKDIVRSSMNSQRNYVQQEAREVVEELFKEKKEGTLPNVDQMMDLILRNKLDEETPEEERNLHIALFDVYWNVLIPKVAGHFAWGPSKRHHVLMSTGKLWEGDEEAPPAVTAEDEAFLATLWHNCYNKWWYREVQIRNKEEIDPNQEDALTPFTNAKGGQKKFGGWKPEAIKFYEEKRELIHKNRKDQASYLVAVETAALGRIRHLEGCEAAEANRRTNKRKSSSLCDVDEDSEDEDDFESW